MDSALVGHEANIIGAGFFLKGRIKIMNIDDKVAPRP